MTVRRTAVSTLLVCALASTADAQFNLTPNKSPQHGIQTTGTAVVEETPTVLRLSIVLTGRAKTLADAIKLLKERQEAGKIQLNKLGVEDQSIKFGDLEKGGNAQQQQMEQMYRQQLRGRQLPKGLETPKAVTVSSTLTADWTIETETQEATLEFAQAIEEKIKAADLAGLNEPQQLTPEEQELQAEMAEAMGRYGQDEENKPGEPGFSFVASVSEEGLADAMKLAFAKAADQASTLATAAGAKRGKLLSLTGGLVEQAASYGYNPYAGVPMRGGQPNVASTAQFKKIQFTVTVTAAFDIVE